MKPFFSAKHNPPRRILVNHQIRAKEVRLIDETSAQVGILPLSEALKRAQERGLDLIQVTERVEPPVCKLESYGKYLYQQEKKGKSTRKHVGGELKEVRLTFNISPHDLEIRALQAEKFLKRGDMIRVSLRLKGRQNALEKFAREKVQLFLKHLSEKIPLKTARELKREPRGLSMLINKE